jgi:hypothetical protein
VKRLNSRTAGYSEVEVSLGSEFSTDELPVIRPEWAAPGHGTLKVSHSSPLICCTKSTVEISA